MAYTGYQGYRGVPAEVPPELVDLLMPQAAPHAGAPGNGPGFAMPTQATQATAPTGTPVGQGFGAAATGAASAAELADLLTGRAMSRNATSIGTGLAQLGEAFIARQARKKADAADEKYAGIRDELMRAAMGGDMAALAQLDLGAALSKQKDDREFGYRTGRDMVMDDRANREWENLLTRQGVEDTRYSSELDYRKGRDAVTDSQWQAGFDQSGDQFAAGLDQRGQFHSDQMELSWAELAAKREADRAKLEAEAGDEAGLNPSLAGLPPGVQSAIVSKELGQLEDAATATSRTQQLTDIANEFLGASEGYKAFGGGFMADLGQMTSGRTNRLKGLTEQAVTLQKKPGTGPMTDDDARRAQRATLSINQPREMNEAVARSYDAQRLNDQAYEEWLRAYQGNAGYGSLGDARQLWMEYSKANPVFDPESGDPYLPDPETGEGGRVPITTWLAAKQREREIAQRKAEIQQQLTGAYDMRDLAP